MPEEDWSAVACANRSGRRCAGCHSLINPISKAATRTSLNSFVAPPTLNLLHGRGMASRSDTRRHWNSSRRCGPGLACKVKEVEQVGLRGIPIG